MSETLILLLGQSPDEPVRWAFVGEGGVRTADTAPSAYDLDMIAARAAVASPVVAVLPGEQVAMRILTSPPRTGSKFHAAAGYLLEDELAEELDTLHVAVSRLAGGAGAALAVSTKIMDIWRDVLSGAGIAPDVMTAEFALLPLETEKAVIIFEPLRMTGKFGHQGFTAERPLADALAYELLGRDEIQSVIAYGDPDVERFNFNGKDAEWRGMADEISLFSLYAAGIAQGDTPNLLQGAYRKRRDWRRVVGPWRRAAMLAAACIVGLLGATVADGLRSQRIAGRLNDEAAALHLAAFPDQANVNPREHARRILSSRAAAPAFLPLSTQFAESLEANGKVQVDRIRFNAARGEFSINFHFSDINDLEELKKALAGRGVIATEAGGVRRSGGHYIGELQVSAS